MTVFFLCAGETLAQIGTTKWAFYGYGHLFPANACPAIGSDGTIYVGDKIGYFYALNPDGTEKWSKDLKYPTEISGFAVGSDGTILKRNFQGLVPVLGSIAGPIAFEDGHAVGTKIHERRARYVPHIHSN